VIFLKSVDIFDQAAVKKLGSVAALTEEVHFKSGGTIYRGGEPDDAICLVLKRPRGGRGKWEDGSRGRLCIMKAAEDRISAGQIRGLRISHDRSLAVSSLDGVAGSQGHPSLAGRWRDGPFLGFRFSLEPLKRIPF
jgi:hypothetical protein